MRRLPLTGLSLAALALGASLVPSIARARLVDEYTYGYDQVWRAAVRMIAVDFRFPITERDPEIGYVLFQYRDEGGRAFDGSLELVRSLGADGAERVRVVVQVSSMPTYVERMMLDRFRRKLSDDYGAAPRPAPRAPSRAPSPSPPPPEPPAQDGGTAGS